MPSTRNRRILSSNAWLDGGLQHGRYQQIYALGLSRQSTTVLSTRDHAVTLLSDGLEFMSETLWAMLTVFGLGIVYFLAAIPTGVALLLAPLSLSPPGRGHRHRRGQCGDRHARAQMAGEQIQTLLVRTPRAFLACLDPLGTASSAGLACAGHLRSLLRCAHRPCAWRKAGASPVMDRRRR